jgi:gamma-glutamyl:cysteine ligase YbdK (ATP-grasp superfamily)
MGEDIRASRFTEHDFAQFAIRLRDETEYANRLFESHGFSNAGYMLGFEVEAWIVDHNYFPASINQRLLETIAHPLVVPELSRFNVELNCEPLALSVNVLDLAHDALTRLWSKCNAIAHQLDANMVMIGTLPTIRDDDLTLPNMSPLNRFYALNDEVLRRRGGRKLRVNIAGRDHLLSEHADVMLEAATTSFQIHLKTPAALAHLYYNASVAASGPILAACGNSPFLFGKSLWDETRIPLFEQAVDVPCAHRDVSRVTFGSGYLERSMRDLFNENLNEYPVLLPIAYDDLASKMHHLRLHNGTIWRWNRPLIGFDADGAPHLRIEHRILPAGPTIRDMIANTAFYLGLVHSLATLGDDGAGGLSHDEARRNFYAAAQRGLEAKLSWPGVGTIAADRLILDHLIEFARSGLDQLQIDQNRESWLDILEARVRNKQTGASWQRNALDARGRNIFELMAAYCERQRSGAPVHEWEL